MGQNERGYPFMPGYNTINIAFNEIESEIWKIYKEKKKEITNSFKRNDAELCLQQIFDIWMFMNR